MKVKIGNRLVGDNEPCFIIAEAGVNHNGDLKRAKRMIKVASDIGIDAIKFQTCKADETVIKKAPMAKYQKKALIKTKSQYDMIKKFEFTDEQWFDLVDYAEDLDIVFFSKPPYEGAVDLLVKLGVPVLKIGSGEVTHLSLLKHAAKTGLPIILSTGMSTLGEIEEAVNNIYSQKNKNIILLHCTTNYPCKNTDANVKAMLTLKDVFQLPVGFSDHTLGITASIAAVSLGACVIEKHFTLDKKLSGPDHKSSLEPNEFRELVKNIRIVEETLGSKIKRPLETEKEIIKIARKSIVANMDIKQGDIIKKSMLSYKRPGTGLPQKYMDIIVGKKATTDIEKDTIITWDMI